MKCDTVQPVGVVKSLERTRFIPRQLKLRQFVATIRGWFENLNMGLAAYYKLCGVVGCLPVPIEPKIITVQTDEIIRLTKDSGFQQMEVGRGTVWLTGTPANCDVLLQRGERYVFGDEFPFVLQAMENTEIVLRC